jgi:hypothetical protein
MTKLENLRLILQWIEDVRSGEMIETLRYTKHYLSFQRVSLGELKWLCKITNYILVKEGRSPVRISHSRGDIIPVK